MTPGVFRRHWKKTLLALVLADWSLPFGLLNNLFSTHRLFPNNLTRIFAEHLMTPESLAAVLVVSASNPLFWTMGGLWVAALLACVRAWKAGSPARGLLLGLGLGQLLFFLLPEILLPWLDASNRLPHRAMDALFPPANRGHGRFYAWLHLPGLALFVLYWRRKASHTPS